jgi:hypothetical protein
MSMGFGERPMTRLGSKGGIYKEGAVCSKISVCTFVVYLLSVLVISIRNTMFSIIMYYKVLIYFTRGWPVGHDIRRGRL